MQSKILHLIKISVNVCLNVTLTLFGYTKQTSTCSTCWTHSLLIMKLSRLLHRLCLIYCFANMANNVISVIRLISVILISIKVPGVQDNSNTNDDYNSNNNLSVETINNFCCGLLLINFIRSSVQLPSNWALKFITICS